MIPLTRWQTEMLVALMAEQSGLWQLPDDPFDPTIWRSDDPLDPTVWLSTTGS